MASEHRRSRSTGSRRGAGAIPRRALPHTHTHTHTHTHKHIILFTKTHSYAQTQTRTLNLKGGNAPVSTTFWCRRCTLQSRSYKWTTSPFLERKGVRGRGFGFKGQLANNSDVNGHQKEMTYEVLQHTPVSNSLHFDVARVVQEFLDEHRPISKCRLRLRGGPLQGIRKLARLPNDTHASAPASKCSFQDDRVPNCLTEGPGVFCIGQCLVSSRDNRDVQRRTLLRN